MKIRQSATLIIPVGDNLFMEYIRKNTGRF